MTGHKLSILHAEDDHADARLIEMSLKAQGIEATWTRVDSMERFAEELGKQAFDLIISDFTMPAFDGLRALKIAVDKTPETPFIYVSGTIGEERAVEALRGGAIDYVLKDKLFKLGPAVEHALRETALRRQRRLAEDELHRAHGQLQRILSASPAIIYTKARDADGTLHTTFMSENVAAVLGHPVEEFLEDAGFWDRGIHPADAPVALEGMRNVPLQGVMTLLYRFAHADGRYRWLADEVKAAGLDEQGRPELVGSLIDVTDQRESEQKFTTLAEGSPSLILIARGSQVLYVNDRCDEFLGAARGLDRRLPGDWREKVSEESRERLLAYLGRVQSGEEPGALDVVLQKTTQEKLWCIVTGALLDYEGSPAVLIIATNVSQLRRLEEEKEKLNAQFQQAQKMDAVGRLAGGIAHDFNNMLMVIQGFTEFLSKRSPSDDPGRRYLEEIRKATDRAAALTHQLLAFSRKQAMKLETLSLDVVVEEASTMIRRVIGEDIILSLHLDDRSAFVRADHGQMTQVLLNLTVNARDAMPTGGTLAIETRMEEVTSNEGAARGALSSGRYVVLDVSDTGTGMDTETQGHLFEPFFTTKEPGKGTGLGLATVYGIIQQCGGYIACSSLPGRGTSFHIHLPVVEREESAPPAPAVAASPGMRGTERILLVEDDDKVRGITREILESAGYVLREAANGVEALALFREGRADFQLVLTDVVMPLMRGVELMKRIREVSPRMPFLIMSGYLERDEGDARALGGRIAFLQKPVSPPALLAAVRGVLDGTGPEGPGSPSSVGA